MLAEIIIVAVVVVVVTGLVGLFTLFNRVFLKHEESILV